MKLKSYEEYNEQVKVRGDQNDWKIILYKAAMEYYTKVLNINSVNTNLSLRKLKKNTYGFVNLKDSLEDRSKYDIVVSSVVDFETALSFIAHELIHAKQIHFNELGLSDDGYILWMGEKHITVVDYSEIKKRNDMVAYRALPWEVEAYGNQLKFRNDFYKSDEFKNLKGANPNLDYLIDNI